MTNFPNLKPYLGVEKKDFVPVKVMPSKSKEEIIKEATEIIESAREIREKAHKENPYQVALNA